MKNFSFKNLVPHLVAIGIFLLVTVIFCKPALESGVVVQQSDVTAVESMKHQSVLYKEAHGKYPLWISSMFSGMPAYNIIYDGPFSPFEYVSRALQLWLPKPLNFFFLCSICFYIFCMCARIRPWVAIFASLAFAYSTYNPILVVAGHDTKLLAMAYAPALIGGILLLFEKKYFSGFVLTALFAALHLQQNHQQISYYVFLIIGFMAVSYLVKWIKEKDFAHIGKAGALSIGAALIGIMINAILIFPVYDYAKDSKRGGQLVMDKKGADGKTTATAEKTTGLSRDYAFQWSNDKTEGFSLLFPGIKGYGRNVMERDKEYSIFPRFEPNSHVATFLNEKLGMQEDQAAEFATGNFYNAIYWGDKPFTSGPAYLGAVVWCLFIIGLFFLDNKHKWWMLAASIFGILLAMGKNLPSLNNFLFDHLPFYNKFRTPEMALVIPQFLFPMLAAMAADKLVTGDYENGAKKFRLAGITMGGIFVVAALMYFSFDYSKENKNRTREIISVFSAPDNNINQKLQEINSKYEAETDNRVMEQLLYQFASNKSVQDPVGISKGFVTALQKDRQAFFASDITKALVISVLTFALIGLVVYKKAGSIFLLIGLPILVLVDLLPIGMKYINEKSFETKEQYAAKEFSASEADKIILADKDPNFRVFDMSGGDPFQDARPSYFHKSIGGYHPAKIGIYDDLATYQLSGRPNPAVLNMLNTKYIIQQSPDGKSSNAYPNPGALGNCWFVQGVTWVKSPAEEMKALDDFNPGDTAVIEDTFKNVVKDFVAADSNASIKQTSFDNEEIKYESNSSSNNLAVFSEVYYRDWKAYIDGKETPVAKANYVLRALVVPAGKHSIVFKFEPKVFNTSYTISKFSNWLLVALLLLYAMLAFKNSSGKKETNG